MYDRYSIEFFHMNLHEWKRKKSWIQKAWDQLFQFSLKYNLCENKYNARMIFFPLGGFLTSNVNLKEIELYFNKDCTLSIFIEVIINNNR